MVFRRFLNSELNTDSTNTLLFLFIGLLIGQIMKHICNKIKVPYTPLLAMIGLWVGLIYKETSHWGDGAHYISQIEPHTFFLIFLPPLIFESAFSIDWHVIKVEFIKVLILAGPCLVVAAFLTAICMRWVLLYDGDFTFEAALLFGALISATDPVAVVSVLKELGASRTLTTLIEGESLVNDGTAYVMFSVVLDLVKGDKFNIVTVGVEFVRLSIGGPALGILFGIVITIWLSRIVNNSLLETNLTVVVAYIAFYTAEFTKLEVSGILSLVALGLYMTKVGKTKISIAVEESLHHIWGYLQWVWETFVFLIAGVIIAVKVIHEDSIIVWEDYLKWIALYVLLHIIRYIVILLAAYPLVKLGYGLTFKQGIVLGYSGLRGAVSLILALTVYLDHEIDRSIRDIVIFHTAGVALLTLLINGTTIGVLVRCLGLMRMPKVKTKLLKNVIKAYRKEVVEVIQELQEKKNFGNCEWEHIKKLACTDKIRDDIFKRRFIKIEESDLRATNFIRDEEINLDHNEYTDDELYIEAKHRYFTTLKGIYWEFFEQGRWSSRAVLLLIESADRVIDHIEDTSKDFKFIETYLKPSLLERILQKFRNTCLCKIFLKRHLYSRISFEYDVMVNFVEAHEECSELIDEIFTNDNILEKVKGEVRAEIKRAENIVYNELEENFSEVTRAVQHKRGGYFLINRMRNFVLDLIKHGQIEFKEAKFFLHHLNKEERNLTLGNLKINFAEVEADFETNWVLAKIIRSEDLPKLYEKFTEHQYDTGNIIIKKGQTVKNLYYISKGIVREKNGPIEDHEAPKIKNKAGDILGLQFVTSNEGLSFTNCYAKTVCTCRVFPIAELLSFITTYEQERMLWLYIGPSIIYLNPNMFNKLQGLDPIQLKALLKESTYRQISKGEKFYLQNGGVLFEGQVEESFTSKSETDLRASDEDENVYQDVRKAVIKNYAFIYPNSSRYTARTICRIFEFPESLREKWLAFNIRIFQEAIKGLPSMIGGNASQTIKEQSTIDRRQRTLLMGLPKGLANADSIKSITQNKARENIYKIDIQNLNYNDEGATIIPKGYTKKVSRLPPVSTSPTEDEKNVKAQEENNQKTITKLDTRTLPITMKPNEDDSSKDDDEENSSEADENESEDEDSSNIISNSNVLAQVSSSDERIQDEEEEESSN